MKCIILAAGYATRLYPLTKNFPKPLLKVAGKPILNHLIEDVDSTGYIDSYVIVTNHKFADIFKEWAARMPQHITIHDDGTESNETRLGAVKDLQLVYRECSIRRNNYLVIAGDNLLDFSLREFLDYAHAQQTSCVMYYEETDHEKLTKTGVLELKGDLVVNMEEKPEHPKSNFVCPPFYYYTDADLARLDEALADGCGYDAPGSFPAWLCHESTVHAWRMPGCRYDIGNLESYEAVKQHFENHATPPMLDEIVKIS